MESLRLHLSTYNKAGFNGIQLQHVLLFWHLNLEMGRRVQVHHFPDTLHKKSKKYLKFPDGTELLKHCNGSAALPNPILCPEKSKGGFSGDQMLIMAAQQCLVCLQRAEMVFAPHCRTGDCRRLKVKAKGWWLPSLRQIRYLARMKY